MKKYKYLTNCVNSKCEDITKMVDNAKNITSNTFFKHVDIKEISYFFGYSIRSKNGLTIKNDWHIRYFKSKFKGNPCYFLTHSCIEYIYTLGDKNEND